MIYKTVMSKPHICSLQELSDQEVLNPLSANAPPLKKFIRWLRFQSLASDSDPKCVEYFRTKRGLLQERRKHIMGKDWFMVHPLSDIRATQEKILLIVFTFIFIYYPFNMLFSMYKDELSLNFYDYVDTICCFVFMLDIVLRFITGYVKVDEKKVVMNFGKTACRYAISLNFLGDVLSAIPFKIIWRKDTYEYKVMTYLRLLKLIRISTFFQYTRNLTDRYGVGAASTLITQCFVINFIAFHWAACTIYLLPHVRNYFWHTNFADSNFMKPDMVENIKNTAYVYVRCLYSAVSYFLCTKSEQYFNLFEEGFLCFSYMVIGKIYMHFIAVVILHITMTKKSMETDYEKTMNQVKEYMRNKKLPISTRNRLIQFYEYKYQKKFFEEKFVSDLLSDSLRREVNFHSSKQIIQQIELFSELPTKVLCHILSHLKQEIYLPNDIIIKANTSGRCMYFLASGTVAIITPTGKEIDHLEDGQYFGELSLLFKCKRVVSFIALEITELLRLDKKVFKECFSQCPEVLEKMQFYAEQRLQTALRIEEEYKQELFQTAYRRTSSI